MRILRFVLILVYVFAIAGCSDVTKSAKYQYAGKSPEQLFAMGEQYMEQGKYETATQVFEHLESTYPFGPQAQQTELDIIYTYYMSNNPVAAKAAAERYMHLYPQANDVDYAYYMRALSSYTQQRTYAERHLPIDLSQRDLANSHTSYDEFNELVTRFPSSRYVPDARQRMIYLRDLFAQYEINIASFYMIRHGYVAAVNRAYNVVQNYQQSPQVAEALEIMVEGYKKLGMNELSDDALKTLALNFPNSQEYRIAKGEAPNPKREPWYRFW